MTAKTRTVKSPDERRSELLTIAQQLFYVKGYENTKVSDIVKQMGVAQGTFYYYFDSKMALLEELATHLTEQSLHILKQVAADESLDALTKMHRIYTVIGNWKTAQKAELMVILQAIFRDENIVLLHKLKAQAVALTTPTLAKVIEQGVREGVFVVDDVVESAEIFLQTSQAFSENFGRILLNADQYDDPATHIKRKKVAYEQAIERILGAPQGSLPLFDPAIIDAWFE